MELSPQASRLWQWSLLLWVGATLTFMFAMTISGILLLLVTLFFLYREKQSLYPPLLFPSTYWKLTALLVLSAVLSLLYAWWSPPFGDPILPPYFLKKFLYFLIAPAFAWCLICLVAMKKTSLEDHPLWNVIFWASLFAALVGIFQFFAGAIFGAEFVHEVNKKVPLFFRTIQGTQARYSHAQGLFLFHLAFASTLSFSYCYALARFLWKRPNDSPLWRKSWGVLALIVGVALFLSYSRIAWVTLFACTIALFLLKSPKRALIVSTGLVLLGALLWETVPSVSDRFHSGFGWNRIYMWQNALEMAKDRPLLGIGFGQSTHYSNAYAIKAFKKQRAFSSNAHNNILEIFSTMGLLGLLAFLAWWAYLFYVIWEIYKKTPLSERWLPAALLVGGLSFQVNGLTQVNFFDAKSHHGLMLWITLVLALQAQTKKRKEKNHA